MNEQLDLVSYIDHTLLKADATEQQILQLCKEAQEFGFYGVCINSFWVPFVKKTLSTLSSSKSSTKIVSVIGFPLGAMCTAGKAFETEWCIKNGADEIDMVINLGALKERANKDVIQDIRSVKSACGEKILKVIIETGLLSVEEKELACSLSVESGADFVKTCTGFNMGAATVSDVELMRRVVGSNVGVKASGGIKTLTFAKELILAGANRLGTSSGVQLAQGLQISGGY